MLGFYYGYVDRDEAVDETVFGYGAKFFSPHFLKTGSPGIQVNAQIKNSDKKYGSIVLIVNHCCEPNCELSMVIGEKSKQYHLALISKKFIFAGDPVTIDYGKKFCTSFDCKCKICIQN